jgi:hypothetical protein
MSRDYIRPDDDDPPQADLAALARQYGTIVPERRIRLLEHQHDSRRGLILEVGSAVPEYYGRRPGALVIAILGNDPYCAVCRRQGSPTDEQPIYVGKNATQRVELED